MALRIATAVLALLIAGVAYFINDLLRKRKETESLPGPPIPNKLFGHLYIADECLKLFPKGVHPHCWTEYIRTKWDLPDVFYLDWRPFGPIWLHIADPELVSQYVTTTQTMAKSVLMTSYLDTFLGSNNLVSVEGAHWKRLRSMFNPGFSATNVMSLADYIVDACLTFREVLEEKARTNELFELEEYATRLTIEIIGKAVLDADMHVQRQVHPIVDHFRERVILMPNADDFYPWQGVDLLRPLKLWWNRRKLDAAINEELNKKIERRAKEYAEGAQASNRNKNRTVLDLALNAYEKEMAMSDGGSKVSDDVPLIVKPSQIPPALRADIIDSVKTFIFAGHDTTSSTMCWAFYLLHRNPGVQDKLKAELNRQFPPGTNAADAIKRDPYIINKLEYTTAVLKETLRLFPPASTMRQINEQYPVPNSAITDPKTGRRYPFDFAGCHVWPSVHLIHRNQRFFPQPTAFIPERFIHSQTPFPEAELFTTAGKEAFRAFERGPRSCIGQELAMIEGKIILALTAREFDFILEFPGEEADIQYPIPTSTAEEFSEETEYGRGVRAGKLAKDRVEGHRLYQVLKGSAKPAGGSPGRVKLRS